jgi:molybdopterin molybdotransferase
MGDFDFIPGVIEKAGVDIKFTRIAVQPGKPTTFGIKPGKIVFGLPGNPVSAFVTFLLLVRPALRKLQGARETRLPARSGVLADRLENRGDRRHFIRVHLDSSGCVRSTGTQASHLLHSLADANGLVDVTPGTVFEAGTTVTVLVWEERI